MASPGRQPSVLMERMNGVILWYNGITCGWGAESSFGFLLCPFNLKGYWVNKEKLTNKEERESVTWCEARGNDGGNKESQIKEINKNRELHLRYFPWNFSPYTTPTTTYLRKMGYLQQMSMEVVDVAENFRQSCAHHAQQPAIALGKEDWIIRPAWRLRCVPSFECKQ